MVSIHHAPGVARGADATALAGIGHEVVVLAVIAPGSGNAMGKNAAVQALTERLADTGSGGANGALRMGYPRNPRKRPGHTDSKLNFGKEHGLTARVFEMTFETLPIANLGKIT